MLVRPLRVRSITVGYGRTHSLPEYCNIKPSITMTVDLTGDEELNAVLDELEALCEQHVHGIIDDALEAEGLSPAFSDEPLFRLYRWAQRDGVLVILPDEVKDMTVFPGYWSSQRRSPQRYVSIFDHAHTRWPAEDIVIILDHEELQREVFDWWNERIWYDLWYANVPEGRYGTRSEAVLLIRTDVSISNEIDRSELFSQASGHFIRCPAQREDLERALDGTVSAELPRHVLDSLEMLDEFTTSWMAEHKREEREEPEGFVDDEEDWDEVSKVSE